MAATHLANAKRIKYDEFYTQYADIQREVEAYLEYNPDVFRGRAVYCNCDDPFESNFFRFFVLNFNRLGLKQLITTSFKPSPVANTQLELFGDNKDRTESKGRPKVTANKFIINEVSDMDGDGEFNLKDVAKQLKANQHNEWTPLKGDGDFRSDESIELLRSCDIVVTNPPFSLFRDYVLQLNAHKKHFLIIGNPNAITYKECFSLIRQDKMWLGTKLMGVDMLFDIPKDHAEILVKEKKEGSAYRIVDGVVKARTQAIWFTNLDHGRRHEQLPLMSKAEISKFTDKKKFEKYDNYDAIEVSAVKYIPSDYKGVMGVPISFLDKYSPEQFEILGTSDNGIVDSKYKKTPGLRKKFVDDYYKAGGTGSYREGNPTAGYYKDGVATMAYKRIFIKHKL